MATRLLAPAPLDRSRVSAPRTAALGRGRAAFAAAALPLGAAYAADESVDVPAAPRPLTVERLQAGMKAAKDHGFLWRLTKGGHTSYLYGTIHAARFEWMFPGPTVMQAIRDSDSIALELDMLDPEIQRRLAAEHRAEPARPLAARAGAPDRAAHGARMRRRGGTGAPSRPNSRSPRSAVMAARRDGFDPAYAIDLVLALVARQLGKPVLSLETPEGQMQALKMPTQAETVAVRDRAGSTISNRGGRGRS